MESDGRRRLRKLHCMKCGAELVSRTLHTNPEHIPSSLRADTPLTYTRQVCPVDGCTWVHYNNPVPIVAALIDHDDGLGTPDSRGVILVRGVGWPASWFGLVTGFLEPREDPARGVLRELKEEVGLEAESAESVAFLGLYPFPRLNQLILAYHIKVRGPLSAIRLQAEEIEAYKKVPLRALRPWAEGTGLAVRDFLIKELGAAPPMLETAFKRPEKKKSDEGAAAETATQQIMAKL